MTVTLSTIPFLNLLQEFYNYFSTPAERWESLEKKIAHSVQKTFLITRLSQDALPVYGTEGKIICHHRCSKIPQRWKNAKIWNPSKRYTYQAAKTWNSVYDTLLWNDAAQITPNEQVCAIRRNLKLPKFSNFQSLIKVLIELREQFDLYEEKNFQHFRK